MKVIKEVFDQNKGDELDRSIYFKEVLDYLMMDIDTMNKKYGGRIGVGLRAERRANGQETAIMRN